MDYKEKLEEAKRLYETANADQKYLLESLFPELKSKADERIRKDIISFLRSKNGYMNPNEDWDFHNRWLPWLERQGEQKPTWSDEDERNLEGIIDEIEANKNNAPDYDLATYDRFLSWLKSLKFRHTWKPTDEQISALEYHLNNTYNESWQCAVIKQLLDDLKQLYDYA